MHCYLFLNVLQSLAPKHIFGKIFIHHYELQGKKKKPGHKAQIKPIKFLLPPTPFTRCLCSVEIWENNTKSSGFWQTYGGRLKWKTEPSVRFCTEHVCLARFARTRRGCSVLLALAEPLQKLQFSTCASPERLYSISGLGDDRAKPLPQCGTEVQSNFCAQTGTETVRGRILADVSHNFFLHSI